mgnify:CR=1 FL=1
MGFEEASAISYAIAGLIGFILLLDEVIKG